MILNYSDINGPPNDLTLRAIEAAFGVSGLGILGVRGVPGFREARAAALKHSFTFGGLPRETLSRYEHPSSSYSFGWSHGKEKLAGKPDSAKGSFYFNPIHDAPDAGRGDMLRDPSLSPFLHPNIWPSDVDAPHFERDIKSLARLMVVTGEALAPHVDEFTKSFLRERGAEEPKPAASLTSVIRESRTHKGRLLYYFAAESQGLIPNDTPVTSATVDSWCGWHNDHSSLTALTPALFFSPNGSEIVPNSSCAGGLYIRARDGQTRKVEIEPDCLAFQIGEAAQIMSGGALQATPHCVRSPSDASLSRGTLAVFCGPEHDAPMAAPKGARKEDILRGARGELLPPGVPTLHSRWQENDSFRDFSLRTLSSYY